MEELNFEVNTPTHLYLNFKYKKIFLLVVLSVSNSEDYYFYKSIQTLPTCFVPITVFLRKTLIRSPNIKLL